MELVIPNTIHMYIPNGHCDIDDIIKNNYKCACGKSYTSRQHLWKHKQTCTYESNLKNKIKLANELLIKEKEIEILKLKLQEDIKDHEKKPKKKIIKKYDIIENSNVNNNNTTTNTTTNTTNTNINSNNNFEYKPTINVFTTVSNKYQKTQPLIKLDIGNITKMLTLKDEKFEGHPIEEWIAYYYGKGLFGQFIGDIVVSEYKKIDPEFQQIWTCDVQRLSFIVRRAIDETEHTWTKDKKGICITKYIIDPLLIEIRKMMDIFKKECKEKTKTKGVSIDDLEKLNNYIENCMKLDINIDLKEAHQMILRYIAPCFQLEV
jgi:hypothetical protein